MIFFAGNLHYFSDFSQDYFFPHDVQLISLCLVFSGSVHQSTYTFCLRRHCPLRAFYLPYKLNTATHNSLTFFPSQIRLRFVALTMSLFLIRFTTFSPVERSLASRRGHPDGANIFHRCSIRTQYPRPTSRRCLTIACSVSSSRHPMSSAYSHLFSPPFLFR